MVSVTQNRNRKMDANVILLIHIRIRECYVATFIKP